MATNHEDLYCSLREGIENTVRNMSTDHHHDHEHNLGIDTVEHLAKHLSEFLTPASVIICVGNDISGDDGAGPMVARQIDGKVPWKVFNVQTVPESFLMKIVATKPDTVLIVDALNFDATPGAVELFSSDSITGQGPSTHGPAPIAFLDILNMFHPCRRVVLGIQPVQAEFGQEMSPTITAAVEMVCQAFLQAGQTDH